MLHEEDTDESR